MSSDAPWRQRRPYLVLWLTGFDKPFREQDKRGVKRKTRDAGRLKMQKKPSEASGSPDEGQKGGA
jgi:hypothetical protein